MEMEMEEVDGELVSLQQSLTDWKYIIAEADMWLRWDQDSYPYIMCGAVSSLFLLLWVIQPPILTIVSLVVMAVCLLDFLVPSVFKDYFNRQGTWSNYKQERFEKWCSSFLTVKHAVISSVKWILDLREKKPNYYLLGTSVSLLTVAFIGNAIPGLLLAYLLTVFLVLLPGLIYHGIVARFYAIGLQVFVDLLKGHKKKD